MPSVWQPPRHDRRARLHTCRWGACARRWRGRVARALHALVWAGWWVRVRVAAAGQRHGNAHGGEDRRLAERRRSPRRRGDADVGACAVSPCESPWHAPCHEEIGCCHDVALLARSCLCGGSVCRARSRAVPHRRGRSRPLAGAIRIGLAGSKAKPVPAGKIRVGQFSQQELSTEEDAAPGRGKPQVWLGGGPAIPAGEPSPPRDAHRATTLITPCMNS